MKKLFSFFFGCAICYSTLGQSTQKTDYLQKSNNKKAVAWTLLGTGVIIDVIGISMHPGGLLLNDSDKRKANTAYWLMGIGTTSMLGSIPFFISGRVNKKRAMEVSLNTEQLQQLGKNSLYTINYPAVTVKIDLGKNYTSIPY